MGKTLRRYMMRELGSAFMTGLGVFTFILLVSRMLELVDLVMARGVPGYRVAQIFAYVLPGFLEITFPMALLLAVVVVFGRLASDGELVAMRTAGLSLYQMVGPVLRFALIIAVATFLLSSWARPWANNAIKETLLEVARERATAALRPKMFNNDFSGLVVYVDRIDQENGVMEGVMVADERDSYRRTSMMARRGRVISPPGDSNLYLQLLDGTSLSFHAGQESYDKTVFASLEVNLALADMKTVAGGKPSPRDMYLGTLLATRRRLLDVGDRALEETIELNRKLIMPVAGLVLALFGVPLGIQKTRTVRARGFAVSLVVILGYFLLFTGSITIVRSSTAPPVLIMWLPNLIFAVGALLLTDRAARDRLQYPPMASWPRLLRRRGKGNDGS